MNTVPVGLTVHLAAETFQVSDYFRQDVLRAHTVDFGLVAGVQAVGQTVRHDPDFYRTPTMSISSMSERMSFGLDTAKAARLAAVFRQLRPPHGLECHDFLAGVEGWDTPPALDFEIVPDDAPIIPGAAYEVRINTGATTRPRWMSTHSCLGMGDELLLGVVGRGQPLAVMDRVTTKTMHAKGFRPHLARVWPATNPAAA